MDICQLETFVEIATLGGFNRAAAQLHVAQSALSRRIFQLEREIGTPLLIRSKRGIQLTAAGSVLLESAQALLEHMRRVEHEVLAEAGIARGTLAIGFPPSLNKYSSHILSAVQSRYPGITIRASVATSVDLRSMLVAGRLDVAIFGATEKDAVLTSKLLFRDKLYLIGSSDARLKDVADWPEIATYPLILTSAPNIVRLLVNAAAAHSKHNLNVKMEVNDVSLILQLVTDGAGYSILPYSSVETLIGAGVLRGTRIPRLQLEWIVANSKERPLSIAAQCAIALVEQTLKK